MKSKARKSTLSPSFMRLPLNHVQDDVFRYAFVHYNASPPASPFPRFLPGPYLLHLTHPHLPAESQDETRTLTFGRDRLGRRSLLINHHHDRTDSSGLGELTIASVGYRSGQASKEGEGKDGFQEVDCGAFWELRIDDITSDDLGKVSLATTLQDRAYLS